MAVDMLRSCYEADYLVDAEAGTIDRLRWFFVDPDTPFLPFSTVFGSANWLDSSERELNEGFCGELPGTQTYATSRRPAAAMGTWPCGGPDEWLGVGGDPSIWLSLDMVGMPLCCNQDYLDVQTSYSLLYRAQVTSNEVEDPTFTDQKTLIASEFAWETIMSLYPEGTYAIPWKVALVNFENPGADLIAEWTECDFPGYAPQPIYFAAQEADIGGIEGEYLQMGPIHFECTANNSTPYRYARGYAVYDDYGAILFYEMFGSEYNMHKIHDYIEVQAWIGLSYDFA
jgi:hypothetical protein